MTYTGLVLLKELGLKLAFSVSEYGVLDVSVVGAKSFFAVPVAAVICVFIFVVVLRIAECIICCLALGTCRGGVSII